MNYYVTFLFLAAVAAGIRSADGIRCYVCNSGGNFEGSSCEHIPEEGNEKLVKDCDNLPENLGRPDRNYTLCRKYVQDVEGDYRVVRSCATDGRVGQCVDRTGTARIKLRYCECMNKSPDEPCNAAVTSAPVNLWINLLTVCITALGLAAVCA